jgi:hypothetical protein
LADRCIGLQLRPPSALQILSRFVFTQIGTARGDIGLRVDAEQVADAEPHDLIRHQGRMTITNTIMVVTV